MKYFQSELVAIGKKHFINIILPKLFKISTEVVDNLMVFIEGSVSYGFCDKNSDIDIDYYINTDLENIVLNRIKNVFINETYWFDSIRVSYGFSGNYWKFDSIINNEMNIFWNDFNPYALYNIKHAIPIWDPKELLPVIKARVEYYPEDVYKKVLRGLWITINDSGEYNALESIKRNKIVEGRLYLYRALEAMLRIVYVLNDRYYPPTKWLCAGIENLDNNFEIQNALTNIISNDDLFICYKSYSNVYTLIKDFMIRNKSIEKECIDNYIMAFQKPFYVFNTF